MKPTHEINTKIGAALDSIRTSGLVPETDIELLLIVRDKRYAPAGDGVEPGTLYVSTQDKAAAAETLAYCLGKYASATQ